MNKKSLIIAATLALLLFGWMASGYVGDKNREATAPGAASEPAPPKSQPAPQMSVQVTEQVAQQVARMLTNQGQTEPERMVQIKAETGGRVEAVLAERGARLSAGDPIVRLAMNDRQAKLAKIKALIAQREQEYQAAQRLRGEGYTSETQLRQAFAALQEARADLEAIQLDIERTTVRAPFAGVLNERPVELGDYLTPGAPVATILDVDPLKVTVNVPQQHVETLRLGQPAKVKLVGGRELQGEVSFIAATSDPSTRTYRVEVSAPNPDGALPAGLSAEVALPVAMVTAHRVSPALLSSGKDGALGVKTVDQTGMVQFHPVQIVRTESDAVWVSGLPERARLITQGQAYVSPGEQVKVILAAPPVEEEHLATSE